MVGACHTCCHCICILYPAVEEGRVTPDKIAAFAFSAKADRGSTRQIVKKEGMKK